MPFEWVISRICEEFNCLPSQAIRELYNDPSQLALEILDLRAYARAKERADNTKLKDLPKKDPAIDRVFEIKHEILKRRREGK